MHHFEQIKLLKLTYKGKKKNYTCLTNSPSRCLKSGRNQIECTNFWNKQTKRKTKRACLEPKKNFNFLMAWLKYSIGSIFLRYRTDESERKKFVFMFAERSGNEPQKFQTKTSRANQLKINESKTRTNSLIIYRTKTNNLLVVRWHFQRTIVKQPVGTVRIFSVKINLRF